MKKSIVMCIAVCAVSTSFASVRCEPGNSGETYTLNGEKSTNVCFRSQKEKLALVCKVTNKSTKSETVDIALFNFNKPLLNTNAKWTKEGPGSISLLINKGQMAKFTLKGTAMGDNAIVWMGVDPDSVGQVDMVCSYNKRKL